LDDLLRLFEVHAKFYENSSTGSEVIRGLTHKNDDTISLCFHNENSEWWGGQGDECSYG
jgi:hypothetical protein